MVLGDSTFMSTVITFFSGIWRIFEVEVLGVQIGAIYIGVFLVCFSVYILHRLGGHAGSQAVDSRRY